MREAKSGRTIPPGKPSGLRTAAEGSAPQKERKGKKRNSHEADDVDEGIGRQFNVPVVVTERT